MIVPEFWAEARLQEKREGRQVTVRRAGWSDVSQEEAQAHAEARANEALQRIHRGEKLDRYESKVAYNGADGMPIREQILARHGEAVITRNLYGARCLNTPDVLFADVDVESGQSLRTTCMVFLLMLAGGAAFGFFQGSAGMTVVAILAALVLGYPAASVVSRVLRKLTGSPHVKAHTRIRRFSQNHPEWHLRVYATPAGFRLLVMHRTFAPDEEAVKACFEALKADPVYVRMCRNQRCFRARLSPKPWRIGIKDHIRPRPGHWPVKPEHLPLRSRWIADYEDRAQGYAACRFLESLGSRTSHPSAEAMQIIHDELCQANTPLPLA